MRRRGSLRLLFLAMILNFPAVALAQTSVDRLAIGKQAWKQGKYQDAYTELSNLRESNYARSFELDFMLGTSACRLAEHRERGARFLAWLVYTYSDKLTDEGRKTLLDEQKRCSESDLNAEAPPAPKAMEDTAVAMARYSGKVDMSEEDRDLPVWSHAAKPPQTKDFQRLLVRVGDEAAAKRLAKTALPDGTTVVSKRFVISAASIKSADLAVASKGFEMLMDFYLQEYGMTPPDYYIFIYFLPSENRFNKFAKAHDGLTPETGTIGYSNRDDLTIASITPRLIFGTPMHELFHILARSNFGDIPLWLDEGYAALYESASRDGDRFDGVPNWRGSILSKYGYSDIPPGETYPSFDECPDTRKRLLDAIYANQRPGLNVRELISNTGLGQDDSVESDAYVYNITGSYDGVKQAVFAASARYFALFLQSKGLLEKVYRAAREASSFDKLGKSPLDTMAASIEAATGETLEKLDDEFAAWERKVAPYEELESLIIPDVIQRCADKKPDP